MIFLNDNLSRFCVAGQIVPSKIKACRTKQNDFRLLGCACLRFILYLLHEVVL